LDDISQKEKLNLSPKIIRAIQKHYQSDIRSMVNFLQTNQSTPLCSADSSIHSATAPRIVQSTPLCSAQYVAGGDVIAPEIINEHAITKITTIARTCDVTAFRRFFYDLTIQYNMDKNEIIKEYFQHLIRGGSVRNLGMLEFIETIVHFCGGDFHEFIDYFYWGIREEFPAPSFTPII
jgi:DNA polymerase III delta prime subunit